MKRYVSLTRCLEFHILIQNKKQLRPSLFKLRVDLCLEEVSELNDGFKKSNLIEVIDALVDEAYVIYGLASSFGINLDKEFKEFLKELYFKKDFR